MLLKSDLSRLAIILYPESKTIKDKTKPAKKSTTVLYGGASHVQNAQESFTL